MIVQCQIEVIRRSGVAIFYCSVFGWQCFKRGVKDNVEFIFNITSVKEKQTIQLKEPFVSNAEQKYRN